MAVANVVDEGAGTSVRSMSSSFPVALGTIIRYIRSMKKSSNKFAVGNRPPQNLSPKAKAQLNRGHRSQAMDELVQKASKAKVTTQLDKEYFLRLLASDPRKKEQS